MTAEDVAWSWNNAQYSNVNSGYVTYLKKAEALDPLTARITLTQPDARVLSAGRRGVPVSAATGPYPGRSEQEDGPLFEVNGLEVHFPVRKSKRVVRAVDGVDLAWRRGEVLGIVGESGCGKSTFGRALLGLQKPTAGTIQFEGKPLGDANMRLLRRRVQMIFQDPYQSLNPRMSVGDQVQEPLVIHKIGKKGIERIQRGVAALEAAGLRPAERFSERYPHELSGGSDNAS